MAKYLLPHFGEIDSENLESFYNVDIEFNGHEINVDLNFESEDIDIPRLEVTKRFIASLLDFDNKNKKYIEQDFADEDGDTVKAYVDHHLEELSPAELSNLIDYKNKTLSPEIQLMNSLKLVRVGIYPDNVEQFAIFDYSIGKELTQYLVVVNADEHGNFESIAMES